MFPFFSLGFMIFLFYYTLGSGVYVQIMQDFCIGTHMAMWFAASIPITYIWYFSPRYPSPTSQTPISPLAPPNRPQCVMLTSLCPRVLIVQLPPMSEIMWCLVFCSSVSLLRTMVSSFICVLYFFYFYFFLIAHHSFIILIWRKDLVQLCSKEHWTHVAESSN